MDPDAYGKEFLLNFYRMEYSIFIQPNTMLTDTYMQAIAPPADPRLLGSDVSRLLGTNVILRTYPYVLFVCNLENSPALRHELGRQREITFRLVGESTGNPLDTDGYDDYYDQLIIWDEVAGRLVGGYRFGSGDQIYEKYGVEGFYINSFFEIHADFHPFLSQCLELGRSFIVPDYQKKNLPLYLLWKGILAYQLSHPQYRYLIGPVSISRFYSDVSRQMLMEYSLRHFMHPVFARWFTPRTPFDPDQDTEVTLSENGKAMSELKNIIDHIRPEHIQFPVLMKQYIRQNARFLGFNLDPNFNHTLDGLMILDIADVPLQTIDLLQREG